MTLWSDLFKQRNLISRTFYGAPGTSTITTPAGAAIIRVSLVGAGAWRTANFGAGAAFAKTKAACTPGDQYSIQVGDVAHTLDAGDAAGDSKVTKVTGSVVIAKAARAQGATRGLASGSIGDVTRDGVNYGGTLYGGASGGDDADDFGLGFGGRGAYSDRFAQRFLAAAPGGGGFKDYPIYTSGPFVITWSMPPGNGRVCVEFFKADPGYA